MRLSKTLAAVKGSAAQKELILAFFPRFCFFKPEFFSQILGKDKVSHSYGFIVTHNFQCRLFPFPTILLQNAPLFL